MPSLGKDLAHIRQEQNLSLDDVYEATKIPKRIIRSIEDDSIFQDFQENPTYIRSYIRSYAKALSIDETDIVFALNKKEKQNYSGSLQKLLETKPKDLSRDVDDERESQSTADQDDEMVHDHVPDPRTDEEEKNILWEEESASESEKPNVRSVDWADMGRQFQPLKTARSRTWVGVLAILFLLAGSGAIYYFYLYDSESTTIGNNQNTVTQQETSQPVSTDSLELDIVSPMDTDTSDMTATQQSSNLQNESLEALPDTLSMVLYAAYGKLEPVRVFTDIMDNINPYWIEQGEAVRFTFVNEIRIRGQFSRMVLLLNGHVVQNFREQFYNPETRLLEINRSYFEGDSLWLQPAPDSLAIDAPSPTFIRERPTFN